jgi:hypothetical protein
MHPGPQPEPVPPPPPVLAADFDAREEKERAEHVDWLKYIGLYGFVYGFALALLFGLTVGQLLSDDLARNITGDIFMAWMVSGIAGSATFGREPLHPLRFLMIPVFIAAGVLVRLLWP